MKQYWKKSLSAVLFIILVLAVMAYLFGCGTIIYFRYIYPKIVEEIPNRIISRNGVKSVSIFKEDISELQITIDFNNEGKIELWNVDQNLKGNITIMRFNNYGFYIFSHRGLYASAINLKLLNFLTDNKFKTVYDFIENYDIIYSLVYKWPNISELREPDDKTVKEIIDRNSDLFPSIIFNGEEIFFAVINYDGGILGKGSR
jgi:hypothetical protein